MRMIKILMHIWYKKKYTVKRVDTIFFRDNDDDDDQRIDQKIKEKFCSMRNLYFFNLESPWNDCHGSLA